MTRPRYRCITFTIDKALNHPNGYVSYVVVVTGRLRKI